MANMESSDGSKSYTYISLKTLEPQSFLVSDQVRVVNKMIIKKN